MSEAELQRSLGRIEAKLEELLRRADTHDESNLARDARIAALESWKSWMTGGMALLGLFWAVGLVFLKETIK